MNGLTQIEDSHGVLYDVNYDCDFERFIVWEHNKETVERHYFSSKEIKHYIQDSQIKIVTDDNDVFKKYLN